jgi:hypothetical protein
MWRLGPYVGGPFSRGSPRNTAVNTTTDTVLQRLPPQLLVNRHSVDMIWLIRTVRDKCNRKANGDVRWIKAMRRLLTSPRRRERYRDRGRFN